MGHDNEILTPSGTAPPRECIRIWVRSKRWVAVGACARAAIGLTWGTRNAKIAKIRQIGDNCRSDISAVRGRTDAKQKQVCREHSELPIQLTPRSARATGHAHRRNSPKNGVFLTVFRIWSSVGKLCYLRT